MRARRKERGERINPGMLRPMRTDRRAWNPPLSLALVAALAIAPMGAGCGKKEEETTPEAAEGGDKAEEKQAEAESAENKAKAAPAEAKAELAEAKEAGLPEAALAPPPVEAAPKTKLEDLLAFVPKYDSPDKLGVLVVVRDASVFIDYADEAARFVEGPIKALAEAAQSNKQLEDFAGMGLAFPMFKAQYTGIKSTVEQSGVHLDKGMLLMEVDGTSYIVYSGDKPEALAELVRTFDQDMGKDVACKGLDAPGYVVCADGQGDLDAFEPGGAAGATAVRAQLTAGLPGVDFEKSNIIASAEGVSMAVETPPGLMVVSMSPGDEPEFDEVSEQLMPGEAKLLGAVQPGAGFIWAKVNKDVIAAGVEEEMAGDDGTPEPVKAMGKKLNGEFLLAGHYEPSTFAMQFGLDDTDDWAGVAAELGKDLDSAQKDLNSEFDLEGGEWTVNMIDVQVQGQAVKALHAGLTGVPEVDVMAQLTGLTVDGYVFAGNDALHVALGASPEAIGHVASASHEGPSAGLMAYLPPSLSSAIEAKQVSMVMHLPFDSLYGPETRQLMESALKDVPDLSPELALAIIDLMSPLSSSTMWITHNGGKAQLHMAVQSIGHHATPEGKDALEAAIAVTQGTEPAAAFGPLVDKYPTSPRLALYKARAGQSKASLVASGVGAMVTGMALAIPVIEGKRNDAMIEELKIEEDAAEKAKEKSKKPPKKPDPKPAPEDKDSAPADDNRPTDDTRPEEQPSDDTKPAEDTKPEDTKPAPEPSPNPAPEPKGDGGGDDGGAPKPPPIIPKKPEREKK